MAREIESFGTAVMDRDDDLPDLDTVIAKRGGEPKKTKAQPAPVAVAPKPKPPKPASQFADPPGIEVKPGETLFKVWFQWAGIEGTYQVPAKTEAEALDILAGHFRKRCKVVVGG